MAEMRHCAKCERTTAHLDGVCQRCVVLKKYPKRGNRKPMDAATKEHLKQMRLWRAGKRATDPRLEIKTEGAN
jgi:hypothetical protein